MWAIRISIAETAAPDYAAGRPLISLGIFDEEPWIAARVTAADLGFHEEK